MSGFGLYTIFMLDRFRCLFVLLAICLAICGIVCLINTITTKEEIEKAKREEKTDEDIAEHNKKKEHLFYRFAIGFIIAAGIAFFMPSTNEGVMLNVIPKLTNNNKVLVLTDKMLDALNDHIDQFLKDKK